MDWITNPPSGEEVINVDWLIVLFSGTKKHYVSQEPVINSWKYPEKSLRDPFKKRFNLKRLLVFCPYCWPDRVEEFSEISSIQRCWKYYQRVIHNTYHGGNIETDHHVI